MKALIENIANVRGQEAADALREEMLHQWNTRAFWWGRVARNEPRHPDVRGSPTHVPAQRAGTAPGDGAPLGRARRNPVQIERHGGIWTTREAVNASLGLLDQPAEAEKPEDLI